ncbi:hypothetical protein V6Z11_D02G153600 [Gossypium hirsutum]|uniref:Uncharacterized protein n=1 Tax=Gossypium hirsutum TaxID=3635 RepID=A0A1U8IDU7_GOSHI|nr:uncharacterized protein LOC107895501 [Gossypium hirsutum]
MGSLSLGRRCFQFGDFVDMAKLDDLGFKGPPFTWHRGRHFERLDRALRNETWIKYFLNSLITHLPKINSVHKPLLFSLNTEISLPRGRPFRFFAGWVEHPELGDFVNDKWRFSGTMSKALAKFTECLK